MIHRALLGSIERFLGVYLEAYQGRLPYVLSPVQAVVIGIKSGGDRDAEVVKYAEQVASKLQEMDVRAVASSIDRPHLSGYVRKIRSTLHPPILIYIGERELESGKISAALYDFSRRNYKKITLENTDDLGALIDEAEKDIRELIGNPPRYYVDVSYMV